MMIRAKRRFPRVPINRPALVRLVEPDPYLKPFEDFTRAQTLGAGGCMFVSPETLGFGSLAVLLISLGHKVVRADTKVVYEKPRQDGSLEVGVEFLHISKEDRQLIESLVAREQTRSASRGGFHSRVR